MHSMVNETSAVPSLYTSKFYEKANEVLLLAYGIWKEDISSEISEEVYLCLIQNKGKTFWEKREDRIAKKVTETRV